MSKSFQTTPINDAHTQHMSVGVHFRMAYGGQVLCSRSTEYAGVFDTSASASACSELRHQPGHNNNRSKMKV
ncbi:hypothetical protein ASPCADRAFT_211123 [Aspergillus carbonarius ITEM 5010]|uniref:Uncharacterized protein n=1 Tax=Aspergillus carbonarius (strain ITEM 5010) TaxID=602072 RepID=A0A1R3R9Z6_ASPC5|nr:hypothetical protein ASPCADRAFT_211123 [Aspergillus carbonarius ITEM 5010]